MRSFAIISLAVLSLLRLGWYFADAGTKASARSPGPLAQPSFEHKVVGQNSQRQNSQRKRGHAKKPLAARPDALDDDLLIMEGQSEDRLSATR